MTLIAAWTEMDSPFLLGDVLIGARGEVDRPHYPIPTRDDVEHFLPPEFYRQIVDTRQKVYKISDSFGVAWAGSEVTAAFVLRNLLREFHDRRPTVTDIRDHLAGHRDLGLQTPAFSSRRAPIRSTSRRSSATPLSRQRSIATGI